MPASRKSEATKVIEFFENADHHAMKITHDIVSGIVKRRLKASATPIPVAKPAPPSEEPKVIEVPGVLDPSV